MPEYEIVDQSKPGETKPTAAAASADAGDSLVPTNPLKDLMAETEPAAEEEHKEIEKPSADNTALLARLDSQAEELKALRADAVQSKQLLAYLRGRDASAGTRETAPVKTEPPAEEPLFALPDKETLAKRLSTVEDAVEFFTDTFAKAEAKIKERLGKTEGGAREAVASERRVQQLNQAYQRDGTRVVERLGRDLVANKEFQRAGDEALARIVSLRTGQEFSPDDPAIRQHYLPGDLYAAAMEVFGDWTSSGKIRPKSANGNGNGSGRPLREIIRERPRTDLVSGGGGEAGGGGDTLASLQLPPDEEASARYLMRELGVTEKQFVQNYRLGEKEHENFGR